MKHIQAILVACFLIAGCGVSIKDATNPEKDTVLGKWISSERGVKVTGADGYSYSVDSYGDLEVQEERMLFRLHCEVFGLDKKATSYVTPKIHLSEKQIEIMESVGDRKSIENSEGRTVLGCGYDFTEKQLLDYSVSSGKLNLTINGRTVEFKRPQ